MSRMTAVIFLRGATMLRVIKSAKVRAMTNASTQPMAKPVTADS